MYRTIAKLMFGASVIFLLTLPLKVRGQESATFLSSAHLKVMGFTLEESTLAEVETKLGPSTPGACSTAADASKMICYASEGSKKTRVAFESGPSGGWSILDGFTVISDTVISTCIIQCKTAKGLSSDVQTNGGLKLGLTKGELVALLGRPAKIRGNRYTFEWSSKRPMTKAEAGKLKQPVEEPYWSVDDTIEVVFRESKVVEFEVHHTVFN